jgi:hypothetical protein
LVGLKIICCVLGVFFSVLHNCVWVSLNEIPEKSWFFEGTFLVLNLSD